MAALSWAIAGCGNTTSNSQSSGGVGGSSGGSSGGTSAGGSGSAGTDSGSAAVFVDQIRQTTRDKLDLLFVVDNSVGMADKQTLLGSAVPGLVERFVNPDCVQTDGDGNVLSRQPAGADPNEPCPQEGWDVEFRPVDDIHIGVITSSLGGHGGDICSPNGAGASSYNETKNDRARLLPTARPELNLPSSDSAGFLAWDPAQIDRKTLESQFQQVVTGAGDVGCGYEATLESWYRFLIDPTPPMDMVVVDNQVAVPAADANGIIVDQTVLVQREAFLRPDSVVAIVMLTDENDCSVVDEGIGWLTAQGTLSTGTFTMPPATTACDANPNDKCCRSCGLTTDVDGCPSLDSDPNCGGPRASGTDSLNLRCYNQKQRFGFDLLYPVERYVAALSSPIVYDTHLCDTNGDCPPVQNPLFDPRGAANPRDPSQIFLAGIVGVPWQDIATDASLADPNTLEYLTANEMNEFGRWDVVLGHPEADNPKAPENLPIDPLMVEQAAPRRGTQPITNEALAPETSIDPGANAVNGHEYVNTDNGDLQYACIFELEEPRDCLDDTTQACDCTVSDLTKNSPLCNPPGGGAPDTIQYYAKAYPGTRLLHTLRDFGDNSIVASICPRQTSGDEAAPAYGYNPAVASLVDRLKRNFGRRCLPRSLVVDPETQEVPCVIVEATLTANECDPTKGRAAASTQVASAVQKQLEATGQCGAATGTPCDAYNLCELVQLSGSDRQACLTQPDYPPTSRPGFCYLDEAQEVGSPALLQGCPPDERRLLRFVGENTPSSGSLTFITCAAGAVGDP